MNTVFLAARRLFPGISKGNWFAIAATVAVVGGCLTVSIGQADEKPAASEKPRPPAIVLTEQATYAIEARDSAKAERFLTDAIAEDGELALAYYLRGRERFRLSKFDGSLADFDRYVKLRPDRKSQQWERGITCYYAGEFQKGADQFELYQTYHDSDVENSVWRFLCMTPLVGVEKAREKLLPIKNDPRIPMMTIFDMYRGEKTPEDVMAAAREGEPTKEELAGRLFYSHLYIGLYEEALGHEKPAREHILKACDDYRETKALNRYMWDVARVHAERLRKN